MTVLNDKTMKPPNDTHPTKRGRGEYSLGLAQLSRIRDVAPSFGHNDAWTPRTVVRELFGAATSRRPDN